MIHRARLIPEGGKDIDRRKAAAILRLRQELSSALKVEAGSYFAA